MPEYIDPGAGQAFFSKRNVWRQLEAALNVWHFSFLQMLFFDSHNRCAMLCCIVPLQIPCR
jgi:hypothetical protein